MLIKEAFDKFCLCNCPDKEHCSYRGLQNVKCSVWHFMNFLEVAIHRRVK